MADDDGPRDAQGLLASAGAREAARFIAAGIANTVITYLLYLALLQVVRYELAYSISFVAGIVIGYTLNAALVFRRPWSWGKLLQYPLVYLFQYAAGIALLALMVESLGVPKSIAPLVIVVTLLPFTFLLSRRIIGRGAPR